MKNSNSTFIDFGTPLGRSEMKKLMAGSQGINDCICKCCIEGTDECDEDQQAEGEGGGCDDDSDCTVSGNCYQHTCDQQTGYTEVVADCDLTAGG